MPARLPNLNKIYQENKDKGYVTLGIALSSDPTQIRFLVTQLGLTYPVLIGNDKVSDAYGSILVNPTTFIIDKQGNVAQKMKDPEKRRFRENDQGVALNQRRYFRIIQKSAKRVTSLADQAANDPLGPES